MQPPACATIRDKWYKYFFTKILESFTVTYDEDEKK
jgi:hypothetical protein